MLLWFVFASVKQLEAQVWKLHFVASFRVIDNQFKDEVLLVCWHLALGHCFHNVLDLLPSCKCKDTSELLKHPNDENCTFLTFMFFRSLSFLAFMKDENRMLTP